MNRSVYKHLLSTFGRQPGYWVGFFCEIARSLLLRVVVTIILAQIAGNLAGGHADKARHEVFYFLFAYVIGVVIGAIGDLTSIRSENLEYRELLVEYYRKLVGKDMSFYRDNQTGYLTSLFRQYLDGGMVLVRLIRGDMVRTFISVTVPVVVLLIADWRLGVVAIGVVVVQIVYITWSSTKANKYRAISHEVYRRVTGEVSDEVTNIVAYKSGGAPIDVSGKMAALAKEETTAFWLRRKVGTLLDLPRGIVTALGITVAFLVVIANSAADPKSVGLIVLTLTYMFQIVRSVDDLPNLMTQHDDLITKLYPTLQYLGNQNETIVDPEKPKKMVATKGAIVVDHAGFSYPSHSGKTERVTVFKDLNIRIQGGEHIGVVGLSGAGKSTLTSLLMRFDDVESGAIKVDGIDIRDVRQNDLRRKIAYVPQEPLLFHRSIRENIAYFNPKASQAAIVKAAKAAHAHTFISKLPDGYDTLVGERGLKLSGGQKQRVVIARAILKNAPIMIFDEATSALDTESEQIIQRALPTIIGQHTAIVIAHRLSTVAGMDRIIVMHNGQIIEEGTHDELVALGGRYYSLWQKQIAAREE